jgi:hypothetical protein
MYRPPDGESSGGHTYHPPPFMNRADETPESDNTADMAARRLACEERRMHKGYDVQERYARKIRLDRKSVCLEQLYARS